MARRPMQASAARASRVVRSVVAAFVSRPLRRLFCDAGEGVLTGRGRADCREGSDTGSTPRIRRARERQSQEPRIDSLISDQVSSGALTGDQATERKTLFSRHGQSTQTSDATSGAGGPPPAPPNDAAAGKTSDGTSSGGSGSNSTNDLLSTFIQQIQSSQSASAGYGASATSTGTNIPALLFDFRS